MRPSTPAYSEIAASRTTAPTVHTEKGAISANGRYSAESETTSVSSLRYAPSCVFCPNSRASMPSIALNAMRRNIHSGTSRNGHRSSLRHATRIATASDTTHAASVTWLAVTPARASAAVIGRSSDWNRGLSA